MSSGSQFAEHSTVGSLPPPSNERKPLHGGRRSMMSGVAAGSDEAEDLNMERRM